jgi:hypothetical protein
VNKGFEACEQVWARWMIWASPPSLRVSNLKQLMAQARETSDLRLGAAALRFGRFEQMSPDRLIGALGQPGLTPAGRGNILYLATSLGSGPPITSKEKRRK